MRSEHEHKMLKKGKEKTLNGSCKPIRLQPKVEEAKLWRIYSLVDKTGNLNSIIRKSVETVLLEKTLESPMDCKEIQLVHSKGDQSWVFFGRNDALEKTDAGRDWGQEEKGTTEDEMAGWYRRLDGCEFE